MKIIDSTLPLLEAYHITKEQATEFIRHLMSIGITSLIISKAIYSLLEGKLPEGMEYYMYIYGMEEREKYKKIKYFMVQKSIVSGMITQVQLNDVREIKQLRNYIQVESILVTGLEDILCYDYVSGFQEMMKVLKNKRIVFCPDNGKNLAVGTILMFVKSGGKEIVTSFAGLGGFAPTEQVIMSLRLMARFKINQDLTALSKLKELFEMVTNKKIEGNMPIIGDRIFWVESGIHVDGILKNPSNYETYAPETVGQSRKIILGKMSGISSVKMKLVELGENSIQEEQAEIILKHLKMKSSILGRSLSDEEFQQICRQ